MSQGQPRRPQAEEPESIKYGDVFQISGEFANKPITPQDATINENLGVVGHDDSGATTDQAVTVSDAEVGGHHVITESVAGEVVGQYVRDDTRSSPAPAKFGGDDQVTIGEALETTAISAGEKPIEQSDAAAIQAAEIRATGRMQVIPGGVAAQAQAAATQNARTMNEEMKTKLEDVLTDASTLLPNDKPVTREDAEGVIGAEIRNQPELATYAGGVAASMAAAARLNQEK